MRGLTKGPRNHLVKMGEEGHVSEDEKNANRKKDLEKAPDTIQIMSKGVLKHLKTAFLSKPHRKKYGSDHQPMAWASALLGDAPPNITPVSGSYLIARHLPWLQGVLTTTS